MYKSSPYKSIRRKRMIKYISYILVVLLIIFAVLKIKNAIMGSDEDVGNEAFSNEELFDSFIDRVKELEKESQEYGENKAITLNSGNLLTYMVYPEGDNTVLNKAIKDWVDKTLYYYLEDAKNSSSELSLQSSSYVIEGKFISVVLSGTYESSSYAHPEDIIKTFTVDLNNNELVSLENIFSKEDIEKIKEKIRDEAKLSGDDVDENLMSSFVITHDGIKIYLKRGDYTPMSDGNVIVNLSKEYLEKNDIAFFVSNNTTAKKSPKKPNLIINKAPVNEALRDKKLIALTFDDGPSIHTDRLLDILEKNRAKATFFVLGSQISKYEDSLIRIAQSGHEIGNHTWDHKQLTKLSNESVEDELMTTRTKIYNTANVDALIIRAPYGSVNDNVRAVAKKLNMYFVHWSIDTLDWKTRNSEATYNAIIQNAGDGHIILCHDIHKPTVDAMDRVIKKLKSEGYEFVTVSELFKLRDVDIEAGKVYYSAK